MKFFAWLQHWVRTAAAASSRKEFYRRIEERKLGEAVAHLALLTVFLWVVPFLVVFFVDASHAGRALTEGLRARIPAGTVFEMKNGAFTNTLPGPLNFGDKDFAVIVNDASNTAMLKEGENGLVVNATGVLQRNGLRDQTVSFKKVPDFRWTRENMLSAIGRWAPPVLFLGALLLGCLMFAMTWIGFLISAFLHALLFLLVLAIAKRPWPLKRAFIAAAFAATGPILLNALLSVARLQLGFVPNALYWLILAWIAYDAIKRPPKPLSPS